VGIQLLLVVKIHTSFSCNAGVDLVGNVAQTALIFHWKVDIVAPTAWLEAYSSLPLLTSSPLLLFSVRKSEPAALVWYTLNYGQWKTVVGSEINVTLSADGHYLLQLKAEDEVGNQFVNTSAWTWVLDTTAPLSCVVVPLHPCSGSTPVNTSTCVLDVTSDEGVVSLQYELDGSSHWVSTNGTVAEVRVTGDGVHTVHVKVCFCLCNTCLNCFVVCSQRVWTRRGMCLLARVAT
jgi:hypothetical protein